MQDWSLRQETALALKGLCGVAPSLTVSRHLNDITGILTQDPHLTKLRELGVDLALDPQRKELSSYLTKIFGLAIDKQQTLPSKKVLDYLNDLIGLEAAHVLLKDLSLRTKLKHHFVPVLSNARRVCSDYINKQLGRIDIPSNVLQQLNIDPSTLKRFYEDNSVESYAFPEIMALLKKKNLNRQELREEVRHLALPILWNLPRIYTEYLGDSKLNKDSKPDFDLLDKLDSSIGSIYLTTGCLDQAAVVYYCAKKAQGDIEVSNLSSETKDALSAICDGVILNLIKRLNESYYTGLSCIQLPGALDELKYKVSGLKGKLATQFQEASVEELQQRAYVPQLKTQEDSDILQIGTRLAFRREVAEIETAINEQWQSKPEYLHNPHDTIIEKMQATNKLFLAPGITTYSFSSDCLNPTLGLLQEAGYKRLIMDKTSCQTAFRGLNRYANRLEGDPDTNSYTVLKDFLTHPSVNDLKEYLFKFSESEARIANQDPVFQGMCKIANHLKAINTVLVDDAQVNTEMEKYPNEKVACLVYRLPKNKDEKSLSLVVEYIDVNKDLNLSRKSIPLNMEKLVAIAAYDLVHQTPRRTKSQFVINDTDDTQLIESIRRSNLIKKLPSNPDDSISNELIVTFCGSGDEGYRKPRVIPRDRQPISPKSPKPAPTLSS